VLFTYPVKCVVPKSVGAGDEVNSRKIKRRVRFPKLDSEMRRVLYKRLKVYVRYVTMKKILGI